MKKIVLITLSVLLLSITGSSSVEDASSNKPYNYSGVSIHSGAFIGAEIVVSFSEPVCSNLWVTLRKEDGSYHYVEVEAGMQSAGFTDHRWVYESYDIVDISPNEDECYIYL